MKTFQKLFIALCFGVTSMFSFVAFASTDTDFSNQNTEFLPGVPKTEGLEPTTNLTNPDAAGGNVNELLASVKRAINRVLGLLALIALIILIYSGVVMLVNARDSKKIEEGYTTVKNVAIALVFIGLSWLVISFIFRAIGIFTAP